MMPPHHSASSTSSDDEAYRREILECFPSLKQKRSLSRHLHQAIDPLPQDPPKLKELVAWLDAVIETEEAEALEVPVRAGREVVEQQRVGKTTYRLEKVKCGKQGCKCADGELHGPYWYSYRKQSGKLKSQYVGKQLRTTETSGDRPEE